jgi:hypothetical protein
VPNRPVIVTTSLSLVVLTTVVMGSTVSTLSKFLFKFDEKGDGLLDTEDKVHNNNAEESYHE